MLTRPLFKAEDLHNQLKEQIMIKDIKVRFRYTEKYQKGAKDLRKDVVYQCIWKMLQIMQDKGYIKLESIITY